MIPGYSPERRNELEVEAKGGRPDGGGVSPQGWDIQFTQYATVSKPLALTFLGLAPSEKQNPQILENLESAYELEEALDAITVRVKQAL